MVVREQTLITLAVEEVRLKLPFPMLGLDVDNDSAFINETVVDYCKDRKLELTRSRAYKKNDQAWIEQKNGSVVRRMVGYGRLEGVAATTVLGELHAVVRLYVNFFQPSFKLKWKIRVGRKYRRSTTLRRRRMSGFSPMIGLRTNARNNFAKRFPSWTPYTF